MLFVVVVVVGNIFFVGNMINFCIILNSSFLFDMNAAKGEVVLCKGVLF